MRPRVVRTRPGLDVVSGAPVIREIAAAGMIATLPGVLSLSSRVGRANGEGHQGKIGTTG